MNKYEKAFNHLREHASFDTVDEMIDIKELVEKAIPKKPLLAFADGVTADGSIVRRTAFVCPSCQSLLIEGQKYCHSCGQKTGGLKMKSFEKYEKEIKEIVNQNKPIAVVNNKPCVCEGKCTGCKFDKSKGDMRGCIVKAFEWLYEEYKEPIKLTRLELEILKYYFKYGYRYIVRNGNSDLLVFVNCPEKGLNYWSVKNIGDKWDKIRMDEFFHFRDTFFDFARSYDDEPYKIKNILDNCEVVEDGEA